MSSKNSIFFKYGHFQYWLNANTYGFHCNIESMTGAVPAKEFNLLDRQDYGVLANLGLTNLQNSTRVFYEHHNRI